MHDCHLELYKLWRQTILKAEYESLSINLQRLEVTISNRTAPKHEIVDLLWKQQNKVVIYGGRCAVGPRKSICASVGITGDRVNCIWSERSLLPLGASGFQVIDLRGFLIMPGFINSHDHLEFALYPRLAKPPYRNYIDWGADIHNRFPNVIAKHRAVPKDVRLWWGGIRNLLCGVTTVSHHNPLWPELQREDFPVRVIREYGWAHSLALGVNLHSARSATPEGRAFIIHACEGIDDEAREELWKLDRLALLDEHTVLVHGLAIDHDGVKLMKERRASLIVCPSSNEWLFGKLPDLSLLKEIDQVALGNDSPLTAAGDLLDEARFAMRFCNISAESAYRMVTVAPAAMLRLGDAEGSIKESGIADLIAVRDTGQDAENRLRTLTINDVEFVMIGGRVQLVSDAILNRLPLAVRQGLEALWIDGTVRWLRAPVKELLQKTEAVLGKGKVQFGVKKVRNPGEMRRRDAIQISRCRPTY
jgi:cytosine/adenosine deaminase-related metal-dependent hydrolase